MKLKVCFTTCSSRFSAIPFFIFCISVEKLIKYVANRWLAASTPIAVARCVLPTPGEPINTTSFSFIIVATVKFVVIIKEFLCHLKLQGILFHSKKRLFYIIFNLKFLLQMLL